MAAFIRCHRWNTGFRLCFRTHPPCALSTAALPDSSFLGRSLPGRAGTGSWCAVNRRSRRGAPGCPAPHASHFPEWRRRVRTLAPVRAHRRDPAAAPATRRFGHPRCPHRRPASDHAGFSPLRTPLEPRRSNGARAPRRRLETTGATSAIPIRYAVSGQSTFRAPAREGVHPDPAPASPTREPAQGACRTPPGLPLGCPARFTASPAFVAQGIEHRSPKAGVAGSNPAGGTGKKSTPQR